MFSRNNDQYMPGGGNTAENEILWGIPFDSDRLQSYGGTMFLINGFQLRGTVTGFDCFTVVLDCDGRQNVIYKHAISTIAPQHPISLMEDGAT